jgi:siroheme synthase (precorrin-2 oxidase/ferrochelatase)
MNRELLEEIKDYIIFYFDESEIEQNLINRIQDELAKPEKQSLTYDEIFEYIQLIDNDDKSLYEFARLIEQHHGITK